MGKSIIVDVPLAAFAPLAPDGKEGGALQPQVRYCEEERPNGRRCPFPALPDKTRCERHEIWQRDVKAWSNMRYPESALGLQETLGMVLSWMMRDEMSAERGRVVVEMCRLMLSNLRNCQREMMDAERAALGR